MGRFGSAETLRINPVRCKMWKMHDRFGHEIDETTCGPLIESVRLHGQKQPALGRFVRDAEGYDIELIYGARRLFAARCLGIDLLVHVRELDDTNALIEMDIENRVRTDISPYERGLSYSGWLRAGYFRSQSELAKALGVSPAQISRLMRFAELPTAVVQVFPSPTEIREDWAIALASRCKDSGQRQHLIQRARALLESGSARPAQAIYANLMSGEGRRIRERAHDEIVRSSKGSPLFRISVRARSIHIILRRESLSEPILKNITASVQRGLQDGENALGLTGAASKQPSTA